MHASLFSPQVARFFARYGVLLVFIGCSVLASPKWMVPAAAWVVPVALLWFFRNQPLKRAVGWGWVALVVAGALANYEIAPLPLPIFIPFVLIASLLNVLPLLADRWLSSRSTGFAGTLIFPCLMVSWEYLLSFGNTGVWPSTANSQFAFQSLIQLASVTGIWGISFLIYWFAAVMVWAASQPWPQVKRGLAAYFLVLGTVVLWGSLRIAPVRQTAGQSVRVAGITVDNLTVIEAMYRDYFGKPIVLSPEAAQSSPELQEAQRAFGPFIENPAHPKFTTVYAAFRGLHDELFRLSGREAQAGAKIILWSEGNAFVLKAGEPALVERGKAFASSHNTYLLMALAVILPGKLTAERKFLENKTVLVSPDGRVLNTYLKNIPVPGVEPSVPGDGRIPVIATPYGNLSPAICYDADFPQLIRQTGQQGTDILLLPSGDWKAISPFHSYVAVFRAVENGFSVVRQVNHGLSLAADPYGNVLATNNFFHNPDKTNVASVPTQRIPTVYNVIGDAFAYACVLGVLAAAGWAFIRRKTEVLAATQMA